jgi:hypothetical protein
MSVLNRVFTAPIDWQAFERMCRDLFSGIWSDKLAHLHGRTGQPQSGVDVYGYEPGVGLVGVQCKGRDQGYGSTLEVSDLLTSRQLRRQSVCTSPRSHVS